MQGKFKLMGVLTLVLFTAATIYGLGVYKGETGQGLEITKEAHAANKAMAKQMSSRASMTDPNGTVSNPYSYYPGTEKKGVFNSQSFFLRSFE